MHDGTWEDIYIIEQGNERESTAGSSLMVRSIQM